MQNKPDLGDQVLGLYKEWGMRMIAFCRRAVQDRKIAEQIVPVLFKACQYEAFFRMDKDAIADTLYKQAQELCRNYWMALSGQDPNTQNDYDCHIIYAEYLEALRREGALNNE